MNIPFVNEKDMFIYFKRNSQNIANVIFVDIENNAGFISEKLNDYNYMSSILSNLDKTIVIITLTRINVLAGFLNTFRVDLFPVFYVKGQVDRKNSSDLLITSQAASLDLILPLSVEFLIISSDNFAIILINEFTKRRCQNLNPETNRIRTADIKISKMNILVDQTDQILAEIWSSIDPEKASERLNQSDLVKIWLKYKNMTDTTFSSVFSIHQSNFSRWARLKITSDKADTAVRTWIIQDQIGKV